MSLRSGDGKITKYDISVGPAYVAHDGSLWIGQSGMVNNIKNGRITRYDTTRGLPAHWVSAITEDDKSLIIYVDHAGIFRFVHGQLKPYLMADGQQYPSKGLYRLFLSRAKRCVVDRDCRFVSENRERKEHRLYNCGRDGRQLGQLDVR